MDRMKKVIYGNIITVDEHKPRAEAVVIEDGIIKYAGSREYAEKLSDGAGDRQNGSAESDDD